MGKMNSSASRSVSYQHKFSKLEERQPTILPVEIIKVIFPNVLNVADERWSAFEMLKCCLMIPRYLTVG